MDKILLLENKIMDYAWGSRHFIPALTGEENISGNPQAEMWMGAHIKAPSFVRFENDKIPLNRLINDYPGAILGNSVADRFSRELPFLFKVLAASKPLSIQSHPDREQAERGFERENKQGISPDARTRNYRDKNHKPELICALTEMWALKGFREPGSISDLFRPFEDIFNKSGTAILKDPERIGDLKSFFSDLLYLGHREKDQILAGISGIKDSVINSRQEYEWIYRLANEYPGDIGVFAPLFLNLVHLDPGEAVYLPARELHAYLEGSGLEIMANSDNVLRGGLTPKHIDRTELLNVLDFSPADFNKIRPKGISEFEKIYESPAGEFALSVIALPDNRSEYKSLSGHNVEILLCTEGCADIRGKIPGTVKLKKGMSALVPSSAGPYKITGKTIIYKATVPDC